jgi:hypothetical protein
VQDARIVIHFLPLALLSATFFITFLTACVDAAFFVPRLGAAFLAGPFLTACFGPTSYAAVLAGVFLADLTGLVLTFVTGFLRGSTSSFDVGRVAAGAGTAGGSFSMRSSRRCGCWGRGCFPFRFHCWFLPCRLGGIQYRAAADEFTPVHTGLASIGLHRPRVHLNLADTTATS